MSDHASVVKSAKRVLEIFEYFSEQRRPLKAVDFIGTLGYPQSSTAALLQTLTALGYLQYDRYARVYSPTLRIAMFSGWLQHKMLSQSALHKMLEDIHAETQSTVVLGMRNEIHAQYIYLVQPAPNHPDYVRPGTLRPICSSAVGRALLAARPNSEILRLLHRANAEVEDAELRFTPADFISCIDRVREQGYALTTKPGAHFAGVMAMGLPAPASQPAMAVGIATSSDCNVSHIHRMREILIDATQPYREAFADDARSATISALAG
jgi:DNA-binding IclR family transcriptional regulator